jgi:hypothetical protein
MSSWIYRIYAAAIDDLSRRGYSANTYYRTNSTRSHFRDLVREFNTKDAGKKWKKYGIYDY